LKENPGHSLRLQLYASRPERLEVIVLSLCFSQ
jgi:hypothetical protein